MKILMMCRLFTPHIGGVEKHVENIAMQSAKDGHDVSVITLQHDLSLPFYEKNEKYVVYRIPAVLNNHSFFGKFQERIVIYLWTISHFSLFISSDRIHIHDVFFWYWPIRFLLPWKKVYITFHGFEANTLPTPTAIRTRQLAEKYTLGNICVGGWITKWYGTKPTYVTYGGADCQQQVPETKRQGAVFIGRIAEDTGVYEYIRAMQGLPSLSLDIYGEKTIHEKLPTQVTIQGVTTSPCSLYPQYEYAFVSSYLSMLEAMQTKTLVVALAINELKEDYLSSHPMKNNIVIVKNARELQRRLKSLSSAQKKRMITACYSWAQKQTWKHVYESTYKNIWQI